ncbi:MAG: response regulator [Candidatus Omnitrophota bacterium]
MRPEASKENKKSDPIDILIIEDNETDVKIALRAFKKIKQKSNVYIVNNGEEALNFIHNEGEYKDRDKFPTPDIILLDINMPKMDGFQFLQIIKKDTEYSNIPVIMLTTSRNEDDIAKSYEYGAASYIQKPVSYENFVEFVDGFNYYWHKIKKTPKHKKD